MASLAFSQEAVRILFRECLDTFRRPPTYRRHLHQNSGECGGTFVGTLVALWGGSGTPWKLPEVLFLKRELTEFCTKLGEFCEKLHTVLGREELTELSPQNSVRAKNLTQLGV